MTKFVGVIHLNIPWEERTCAMCGVLIMHGAVDSRRRVTRDGHVLAGAHLLYRASFDIDGQVWIPVRMHRESLECPDPPPGTASFWEKPGERESWKRDNRKRHSEGKIQKGMPLDRRWE